MLVLVVVVVVLVVVVKGSLVVVVVVVVVLLERFSHLRKRRKSENVPGDMHDSVGQIRISDLGKIATRALRDATAANFNSVSAT